MTHADQSADEILLPATIRQSDEPSDLSGADPFTQNSHELMIIDGRCSFTTPVRTASYPRYRTYKALAKWLTRERSSFLGGRDWWDLGPANASELDRGCSVLQQDLLQMLTLDAELEASSFSRFLDECELVWPDGVAPVRILFSHEAKLAWVARAVTHFVPKSSEPITEETLKMLLPKIQVQGVPLSKKVRFRWEDVLKEYGDKMLHSQSHDPANSSAPTAPACS
ncbi:MAG: hypothetical protein HZA88_04920 [Verrucomicrobia bacterium]|nr:hypothetical protein [Verrucomicrobiota bacterium]